MLIISLKSQWWSCFLHQQVGWHLIYLDTQYKFPKRILYSSVNICFFRNFISDTGLFFSYQNLLLQVNRESIKVKSKV